MTPVDVMSRGQDNILANYKKIDRLAIVERGYEDWPL